MCIFDSTSWGEQKSANALEAKILIFLWENVYFLETEEGLLVAWDHKIFVFRKEITFLTAQVVTVQNLSDWSFGASGRGYYE